jgi:asparagine synthase (glutamine-hydrolysing)
VVAALKEMSGFDTFTAKFPQPEFDETPYASQIAEMVGGTHHEVLVEPSVIPDLLPTILQHLDEPRAGPGVIPQFLVSQLEGKTVRVVLTGHGGDELFAGYPSYVPAYLGDVLQGGASTTEILRDVEKLVPRLKTEGVKRVLGLPLYALASRDLRVYGRRATFSLSFIRNLLRPALASRARGYEPRRLLDAYLKRAPADSHLSRLQYLDIKTYLPSLLDNEDRASMAYSVEARVPLLDHRMAQLASSLSPHVLMAGFILKNVPRQALAGYLPKEVLSHRKMGFPVPISQWFREDLAPWVDRVLAEDRVRETGILEPFFVRKLVEAHWRGTSDFADQIWALLNVEIWFRRYHPALN